MAKRVSVSDYSTYDGPGDRLQVNPECRIVGLRTFWLQRRDIGTRYPGRKGEGQTRNATRVGS